MTDTSKHDHAPSWLPAELDDFNQYDMSLWPKEPEPVRKPQPGDPRFKTVEEEDAYWEGVLHGINTLHPETDVEAPLVPLLLDNASVPVRQRMDGWTPDRQRAFLEALAYHGQVRLAAYEVGMTPRSAYRLRQRPDGRRSPRHGTARSEWR